MSIPAPLDTLPDKKQTARDCTVMEIVKYPKNAAPIPHKIYRTTKNYAILPFHYAYNKLKYEVNARADKVDDTAIFSGELYDEQKQVAEQMVKQLKQYRTCVLSVYVGYGKSFIAAYLSLRIRYKTMIIVHRLILLEQWKSIFETYTTATVQILGSNDKMNKDADVYLMNAINIPKRNDYNSIGLVVVDEVHCICTKTLSKSLQHIFPQYMIGLSATPYREDGLDEILNLYFGKERIKSVLKRKHHVHLVRTHFKPKIEYDAAGRIKWNSIIESIAKDERRNEIIITILKKRSDINFLVLVKRISQGKHLLKRMKEASITCTSLLGKETDYDRTAQVLVATTQKVNVGFSDTRLNGLLLATDVVQYFIQILGRVFRTRDVIPEVYDLVDKCKFLERHLQKRIKVYKEVGGEIVWEQ